MNGRERQRLDAFVEALLAPVSPRPHGALARDLLGTNFQFERADLGLMRRLVVADDATAAEWSRLNALLVSVRKRKGAAA